MKPWALYNENDAQKAAWLRELIRQNVVAPGEVDERSITEVQPEDLRGFIQCHFFAGIGVWSYALRLAGWPDDRPVWTGSCPCPSFSAAGKGKGFADPRHLWPYWIPLIQQCQPATVIGEQVASAIGHGWLDVVYVDMEAASYSVGAAVLGACGVGAPHIRQRLYFGAHAAGSRRQDAREYGSGQSLLSARSEQRSGIELRADSERDGRRTDVTRRETQGRIADGRDSAVGLSPHSESGRLQQRHAEQRTIRESGAGCESGSSTNGTGCEARRDESIRTGSGPAKSADSGSSSEHSHSPQRGLPMHGSTPGNGRHAALTSESFDSSLSVRARLEGLPRHERDRRGPGWLDADTARSVTEAGATRGFWGDCDWWYGRDGKYRPIEPGLFPLAHGASNRVLKLRGYGDAIVPQVAAEFIQAFAEAVTA